MDADDKNHTHADIIAQFTSRKEAKAHYRLRARVAARCARRWIEATDETIQFFDLASRSRKACFHLACVEEYRSIARSL
jgi:hypothetical protein